MAGEVFYKIPPMPQGTIPRIPKVLASSAVIINDPLPTRREIFSKIREAWNIPSGKAITNQSLGRWYKASWDVPDVPPPISMLASRLARIVAQHYGFNAAYAEAITQELLRQQAKLPTPALLPSIDTPVPGSALSAGLLRILQIHQEMNQRLVDFRLPPPTVRRSGVVIPALPPIVIPPPTPITLGSIAFQPDAFFIGYPGLHIGFQGANRYVRIDYTFAYPYIEIVAIRSQTGDPMDDIRPGDTHVLGCDTYDPSAEPKVLITPEEVRVTLYNPDGTIRLDSILLTPVSLGRQIYRHQTALDDQLGVYLVEYRAQNFGNSAILPKQAAFRLVEG